MSLHYIYSIGDEAFQEDEGFQQDAFQPSTTLDLTQYCRLYRYASTTDAKEGSVGMSTLIVDDKDGTLDFTGHRRLYTYEDLAPANEQVVHNGYIAGENVSRGPYRIGAGRIWTLRIADTNVLLNRRIMNGTDANRSAETDLARIQALLTMTELNTIDDSLYVNTAAATTAMDAVDYRGQPAGTGYIADCAQASGKNYFAWYREATGVNSLWYDFASSSNWSSTIRLTNSLADVDDTTTFAIDLENQAELDRDPSRVASGIYLTYDGGTVYVQDATTTATFGAIDYAAPSSNVKTLAKATARANRYLADASAEDDLINVSVKLPAANVNDILAGMRVEASFTHLPGYEAYSWMRCLSRTVTEISEDPTRAYRLDLELAPEALFGCIQSVESAFSLGGSVEVDFPQPIRAGSLIWYWTTGASDADPVSGYTETTVYVRNNDMLNFSIGRFGYKVAGAGESQHLQIDNYAGGARPVMYACELVGVGAPTSVVATGATSETGGPNEGEPWVTDPYPTNPVTASGPGYVVGGFVYWYPSGSSECPPSSGNGPWTVHMTNFLPTGTVVDAEEPFDSNGAIGSQFSMTSLAHVEVEQAGSVTLTGDGCSGYYAQGVYTGAVLAFFPRA